MEALLGEGLRIAIWCRLGYCAKEPILRYIGNRDCTVVTTYLVFLATFVTHMNRRRTLVGWSSIDHVQRRDVVSTTECLCRITWALRQLCLSRQPRKHKKSLLLENPMSKRRPMAPQSCKSVIPSLAIPNAAEFPHACERNRETDGGAGRTPTVFAASVQSKESETPRSSVRDRMYIHSVFLRLTHTWSNCTGVNFFDFCAFVGVAAPGCDEVGIKPRFGAQNFALHYNWSVPVICNGCWMQKGYSSRR